MASLGRVALAVLGILAYQNREKIGTLLRGKDQSGFDRNNPQQSDGGGLLEKITDTLGSGGGLRDILDQFRNSGSREEADSWVGRGPNKPLHRDQVEAAIEPETLEELSRQTGLTREELVERIAKDLPEAVDAMTPNGRLPEEGSAMAAEPTLLDDVPPRRQ